MITKEIKKKYPDLSLEEKKKFNYVCNTCGEQAIYNLQSINKLWDIIDDNYFEENNEWEGDINLFLCEKCYDTQNF